MRLIDADRLLSERLKRAYYHLPNGDIAIPIIDIEHAPIVDAAPVKHGKWFDKGSLSCRCSKCGCKNGRESKFCPNCGAKMEGDDE